MRHKAGAGVPVIGKDGGILHVKITATFSVEQAERLRKEALEKSLALSDVVNYYVRLGMNRRKPDAS